MQNTLKQKYLIYSESSYLRFIWEFITQISLNNKNILTIIFPNHTSSMRTLEQLQENNNPNSGPRPSLQKLQTSHSATSHDLKNISQSPNSIIHNIKSPQNSYISQALQKIEKGCVDQQTGQLKIDGHFGDYRMKIFRKKDKL